MAHDEARSLALRGMSAAVKCLGHLNYSHSRKLARCCLQSLSTVLRTTSFRISVIIMKLEIRMIGGVGPARDHDRRPKGLTDDTPAAAGITR